MRPLSIGRYAAPAIFSLLLAACGGGGGSAPPPAPPTVSLSAAPTSVVTGSSSTLTWSSTNATSCAASGGWSGTKPTAGSEVTPSLTSNASFSLACSNAAGGTATASVTVTVTAPPAVVITTFTATPASIPAGASATLNWATNNATACTASGGWTGSKGTSGSQSTGPLATTTAFSLNCTGPGASASASVTVTVAANSAPIANAGSDRTAFSGNTVSLIGAQSSDSDGTIVNYAWTQTFGPAVTLATSGSDASFTAPTVAADTVLTFRLIVTDNSGAASAPDFVDVIVKPVLAGSVPLGGRITFARIPVTQLGWNYAGTVQQPARNIRLEIVNGAAVQSNVVTDTDGFYTAMVPANTNLFLRARAELGDPANVLTVRVEVRDVDGGNTLHTASSGNFNTGTGSTQNLAIQSGWTTAGVAPGTRAAAPFAVLDTIYRALGKVRSLSPTANIPALLVDWAPNNTGGVTFFTTGSNGNSPKVVLAGEPNVDTDEYDQHVIAHEFGHFTEWVFSRADSIGGSHSAGDRLDPRVSWGEGYGYWFACFVMDDTIAIDTFSVNQLMASRIDVEANAPSIANPGWWSESSVFSILWDLYDAANDDAAAVGAAPMWAVLTSQQKSTEAFTTMFSFVSALKLAAPSQASQIDSVVGSHPIVSATMDEYGSTEINNTTGISTVLPVYKSITQGGGSLSVTSVPTLGTYNKLGIRNYLKLTVASPRTVSISATGSAGRDPDLIVYYKGAEIAALEVVGNEPATNVALNQAGTYVLEVYDCDNVGTTCDPTPSPATTSITVQVQ